MSITVKDDYIYVDDGEFTFEDLYKEASNTFGGNTVEKAGDNYYYFDYNIVVGKDVPATLSDTNKSVFLNKEYFQLYEGSTLKMGEKGDNGKTLNGCRIDMPNAKFAYGFGRNKKDDIYTLSGDLYLYDSYLNIPCFWGFFNKPDKQKVEIIDCTIYGLGRISGENSIIENVIYLKADKKYGTISVLGKVKQINNVKINKTDTDNNGVCLYFNPDISGNCAVSNIELPEYKKLIYCESTDDPYYYSIIDSNINNDECEFEDENTYINIQNTVTFLGDGYNIEIFNKDNKINEFNTNDKNSIILTHRTLNKNGIVTKDPYIIRVDNNFTFIIVPNQPLSIPIEAIVKKMRPLWDKPFFFGEFEKVYLGNLYKFYVKSYKEPTIKLYKNNGKVIATPDLVKQQVISNMWAITILIGELGEEGDNEEKWVDGLYYLHGIDTSNNQEFVKSIYIDREENSCATHSEISTVIDKLNNTSSDNNGNSSSKARFIM